MARENREYVRTSLAAGAVVLWYLLYRAVDSGIIYFRVGAVLGAESELARTLTPALIAAAVAVAAYVIARRHPAIDKFGTEVVIEMRRVTWPAKPEVNGSAMVVSIMVTIVAVILFVMDKGLDALMTLAL